MPEKSSWRDRIPGGDGLSPSVIDHFARHARLTVFPQGARILDIADPADALLLMLSGTVCVQNPAGAEYEGPGYEIVQYRVHAGQGSGLTSACLLAFEDHSVNGIAETDIEAIQIPREAFDDMMAAFKEFRAFVFKAYSKHVADLFQAIQAFSDKRSDIRSAQYLLEPKVDGSRWNPSRPQSAIDPGAARDAISHRAKERIRLGAAATRAFLN